MYVRDIEISGNATLVRRKIIARSIGGGLAVYVEAKPIAFARLCDTDLVDSGDVCRIFGCSARSLYRWVGEGQLRPQRKVGRQLLFTRAELVRWREERPALGRPPGGG